MASSLVVDKWDEDSDLVEKMEERGGEYPRVNVNWVGRYLEELVEETSSSSGTRGSPEEGGRRVSHFNTPFILRRWSLKDDI